MSVKVNSISPYHDASPGGHNDYSKWNFTLSPVYTAIKQGQNKITAKFACSNEPTLASHYSVNVTGVSTGTTPTGPNHQYLQPTSIQREELIPRLRSRQLLGPTNAIHASLSKPSPVNNNSHQVSLQSLSIRIGKSSVHPGDTEIVTIVAFKSNCFFFTSYSSHSLFGVDDVDVLDVTRSSIIRMITVAALSRVCT